MSGWGKSGVFRTGGMISFDRQRTSGLAMCEKCLRESSRVGRALPRFEDAISHDGVRAGFVLQNRLRSGNHNHRPVVMISGLGL